MRPVCTAMICALIGLVAPVASWADDTDSSADLARVQLNRVIKVLRLQPSAASPACLDSLAEMHKTEDQVKALRSRAKDPDTSLAMDVLETDYENASEICGADASRVCLTPNQVDGLPANCAALHEGNSSR